MKVINILMLVILLASCNARNNKNNDVENAESKSSSEQTSSLVNCYRYTSEFDTVTLKLIHVGTSITGTLVYNLKEKDKNKGTIQGAMSNDVLVANYTFMSEGVQSVRQVAFKLQGNTFTEGYGDSFEKDGKVVFKDVDALNFTSQIKLQEVACQ